MAMPTALEQSNIVTEDSSIPSSVSRRYSLITVRTSAPLKRVYELEQFSSPQRLPANLAVVDALLDGGVVYGRINEIIGPRSSGKTSLAACFAACATRRGELVAWVDSSGTFDPSSLARAGVDLTRVLWVFPGAADHPACRQHESDSTLLKLSCNSSSGDLDQPSSPSPSGRLPIHSLRSSVHRAKPWRAAELILEAGGFGLLVLDLDGVAQDASASAVLKLASKARQSGTAVLVLARQSTCGAFAALTVALTSSPRFSRSRVEAPNLFEGLKVEAEIVRNKLGLPCRRALWYAMAALQKTRVGPASACNPRSLISASNGLKVAI